MSHVIVDSRYSLTKERFQAKKVTVVNGGKKIKDVHPSLLNKKLRKEISRLLRAYTEDLTHRVENALESGNNSEEFELRKQFCISIEN